MIDVEKTIISQYANSPIITQLINNFNQYIDQSANIENFLSYVWDVSTAQDFGLDIWGRIVGVSRNLTLPSTPDAFGYSSQNAYTNVSLGSFLNVTRNSIASYYDSSKVLRYAAVDTPRIDYDPITGECKGLLIEESRTNLLTYSNRFDNTSWSKSSASVTPNSILSVDGTLTAASVSTSSANSGLTKVVSVAANGESYCASVDLKWLSGSTSVKFRCALTGGTSVAKYLTINAQSGAVIAGDATYTIAAIENNWYRISVIVTNNGTNTSLSFQVYPSGDAVNTNLIGICCAQLELGAFPTTYIPSPDTWTARASTATYIDSNGVLQTVASGVARSAAYDYDSDGVLRPIGLLLEGAATNLLLYSEQLDNAVWVKSAASITANAVAGPDGTTTADKLVEDSSTAVHLVRQTVTASASTIYTKSVHLKKAERSIAFIEFYDGTTFSYAFFDLTNGTVLSATAGVTASIKLSYNGFYRCSASVTTGASATTLRASVSPSTANAVYSYAGDGTSGIYAYGAQLAAGTYATSYIATTSAQATRVADASTSAQATRAADVINVSGDSNFTPWFNQGLGTLFAEYSPTGYNSSTYVNVLTLQDATDDNKVGLRVAQASKLPDVVISASGASTYSNTLSTNAVGAGVISRSTVGYFSDNSVESYANGSSVNTTYATSLPQNINNLAIGGDGLGASVYSGHIRNVKYFPTKLSQSDLIGICDSSTYTPATLPTLTLDFVNLSYRYKAIGQGLSQSSDWQPWGQAPFYSIGTTSTYALSDEAFRSLILIKALANISTSTVPALNQLLLNLFSGRGRCYINDLGDMQIRYTFEFALEDWELAIITNSGAFPRPSGVYASVMQAANEATFGFNTNSLEYQPFNQGTFLSEGSISAIK